TSTYTLELPEELVQRRIHPKFHVSRLRPYVANDDTRFPGREANAFYDFGNDENTEWQVSEISAHRWVGARVEFQVQWNLGDTTWESYTTCKELQKLDEYLQLQGVATWRQLP
ncbi:hypothetical protein PLICRDRAFT_73104, partial [Plicaturopsis crispa FD-325 SS-3]